MKLFCFLALAVIGSVAALPKNIEVPAESGVDTRFIDGIVAGILEGISEQLKEQGYDPFIFNEASYGYALPVPGVFSALASLKRLVVSGISDIVINQLNYSVTAFRLRFDISLPSISIALDDAVADAIVLNNDFKAGLSGSFSVKNVGVKGEARFSVLGGISVRDLDISLYLDALESKLDKAVLFGTNYADEINQFINVNVYNAFVESSGDINELVNIIAWDLIDDLL